MSDYRLPKILLHAECDYGQRDMGQPPVSYRTCVKKDLVSFGISISKWQSLAYDRKVWRKAVYDGRISFLNQWWEEWIKKYNKRHRPNKVVEESNSKGSYENYSNSRLQQILLNDKLIPSSESD